MAQHLYTVIITVCCFSVSIALLIITKYVYVAFAFKYPLWLTATHMVASYIMTWIMVHPLDMVPNRRRLTNWEKVVTVAPFSMLGATSIACGNGALVFLYPSLHEMVQNTTPFWAAVCSIIFVGKSYNTAAYLALIPVTCGGVMCAWGEPSEYAMIGLVISCSAAVFRAMRAIVQANIMRGQDPIDSITLLNYAAPFNLALFLISSALIEGVAPWMDAMMLPGRGIFYICLGACCAGAYNFFAFLMCGHLGAVGSQVIGNLKTPTIIIGSMLVFGNKCAPLQVLGFMTSYTGGFLYTKYGKERSAEATKSYLEHVVPEVMGGEDDEREMNDLANTRKPGAAV